MSTRPERDEYQPNGPSFYDRLCLLEAAIPGAVPGAQALLTGIYHSTRRLHDELQRIDVTPLLPRSIVSRVRCFDCGTTNMDSFHTSTQGGYHLCPTCFQHRLSTGRAKTAH